MESDKKCQLKTLQLAVIVVSSPSIHTHTHGHHNERERGELRENNCLSLSFLLAIFVLRGRFTRQLTVATILMDDQILSLALPFFSSLVPRKLSFVNEERIDQLRRMKGYLSRFFKVSAAAAPSSPLFPRSSPTTTTDRPVLKAASPFHIQ